MVCKCSYYVRKIVSGTVYMSLLFPSWTSVVRFLSVFSRCSGISGVVFYADIKSKMQKRLIGSLDILTGDVLIQRERTRERELSNACFINARLFARYDRQQWSIDFWLANAPRSTQLANVYIERLYLSGTFHCMSRVLSPVDPHWAVERADRRISVQFIALEN